MPGERPDGPDGLSVSHLSYSTFDNCRRAWLLRYGYNRLPGAPVWTVLEQRRLAPWQTFAGGVVDRVISRSLLEYRATGRWPDDLPERAREISRKWWEVSVRWVRGLGHRQPDEIKQQIRIYNPLDRHYYREPFTPDERQAIHEQVEVSLATFSSGPIPKLIEGFPLEGWRGPAEPGEPLRWYQMGRVPVWSMHDFAMSSDDRTIIIDWKTGKRSQWSYDDAVEQLHWYALCAVCDWQVPADKITLMPVWLYPDLMANEHPVSTERLEEIAKAIEDRFDLLNRMLPPDDSPASLDEWPMTEQLWRCKGCQFRGWCEGSRRPGAVSDPQGSGGIEDSLTGRTEP